MKITNDINSAEKIIKFSEEINKMEEKKQKKIN